MDMEVMSATFTEYFRPCRIKPVAPHHMPQVLSRHTDGITPNASLTESRHDDHK